MSDLILEFYSEEIPSRMQKKASIDLKDIFTNGLDLSGLDYSKIYTFVTPRRLTLIVKGLSNSSNSNYEEKRGPRVGSPEKAIEGFTRSLNIDKSSLFIKKEKKGEFYFYKFHQKGNSAKEIISKISIDIITNFPWKKSMRWGEGNLRWVRPLKFVYCALFDNNKSREIIDLKLKEISSVNFTLGHYMVSSKKIFPKNVSDYLKKLKENKVILDRDERKKIIVNSYTKLLKDENSCVIYDEDLVEEIIGLVEWPVVFLGYIDEEFLSLPKEILQVTMKEHQKFLSVINKETETIDKFIVVANMLAEDGGKSIMKGNSRVLRSRLKDAKFFFENDIKVIKKKGLSSLTKNLNKVIFHNRIGSQLDRVNNIEKLSQNISKLMGVDNSKCKIAARLCKTDLVTHVVSEFPELQGVVGKIYADYEGIDQKISNSIAEHYLPIKLNDKVPTQEISIVIAMSDKINSLISFWKIKEKPTGSKDPFALRRSAIGLIRILLENNLDINIGELIFKALEISDANDLIKFLEERFRIYLLEKDFDHDLLESCLKFGNFNNPYLVYLKIESIKEFKKSNDFKKLMNSYKRPINILNSEEKKNNFILSDEPSKELFENKYEKVLFEKLIEVEVEVSELIKKKNFILALTSLSTFDDEIENFFENVVINVDKVDIKINRLKLCNKIRKLMHSVAYFGQLNF